EGGISNYNFNTEDNQDYLGALAEVKSKAAAITEKNYTLITAYWEDYNFQVTRYSRNHYDNNVRPAAIQSLKDMASSDSFVMASSKEGENIDDFVAMLARIIESHINVSATFNVTDKYEIVPGSVSVSHGGNDYSGTATVAGNEISVILPDEAPAGMYTVKPNVREKLPLGEGAYLASTGILRIQGVETKFPDVKHTLNENDSACTLIIEKRDAGTNALLPGAVFDVAGPNGFKKSGLTTGGKGQM